MEFNTYLNAAWDQHVNDSSGVADGFEEAFRLVKETAQINQLAHLITHVMGEHLGRFEKGQALLNLLKSNRLADSETHHSLARFSRILSLTEKPDYNLGSDVSSSDLMRIYSSAASALLGLNQVGRATSLFKQALAIAETSDSNDPGMRAMAVSGNNLASTLIEKSERTPEETELMILAAKTGRKYWEIAGTWLEVERAEYRLAQSYLQARDFINSIKHANLCLTICEKNNAEPLEFFFAFEAIAQVEKAMQQPLRSLSQMEKYLDLVPQNQKSWCVPSLEKLKS